MRGRFCKTVCGWLGLSLVMLSAGAFADDRLPTLNSEQANWVADRIFQNECNRQLSCLTSWNVGEDFPSLGIGHFIWYREGQRERFVESFPELLGYYVARGVDLPPWLAGLPGWASPWPDRETFLAEIDSEQMQSLRQFLSDTRGIQADFIMRRLEHSLPALTAASDQPAAIATEFYRVANSHVPHGMYALIDYVNFKGEGTATSERYRGQGWGLLQVLETMLATPDDGSVLEQFAAAAQQVLARRIDNSPAERGEERWRSGWNNRTRTYVP
ncbi:hypothetical protein PHACT_03810 [Pseudohongiella acticola]|uniref:Uncharacterized protein n=1 Tax=Pseudohongiella acticola TaxID=1524254 RepID=A0A1E8CIY9_9GAMM|nr:hypothetical protein [Pseudohongiella acticola]OFE12368.1 hypothetical protein PHACT_03810 [Pseudohongiella acticola]